MPAVWIGLLLITVGLYVALFMLDAYQLGQKVAQRVRTWN